MHLAKHKTKKSPTLKQLSGSGQQRADAGHVRGGVQEPEDEESVVPLLLAQQELAALRPRSAAPSGRPRILPVPQPVRVHRRQPVSV